MTVLRSGSATDVGRVRSSNQDLALEESNLFAVADGMGGHAGGEVASRVAVDSLRSAFSRQPSMDGLRQAVAEANGAVWSQGQNQSELRGMGTTITAVALVAGADGRDVIALANVGDSRAYVFSGGRLVQVTSDHSLAEEKVRQGELTEAEAAVHPHRHILTRALGVSPDVDVDLWELHLREGDRILLCSDGLTNEVGFDQLAEVLGTVGDPAEAAQALVQAALDHGGSDNVTVLVVDVLVGDQGAGQGAREDAAVLASAAGAVAGADVLLGPEPSVDPAAAEPAGANPVGEPGGGVGSAAASMEEPVTGMVLAQPREEASPPLDGLMTTGQPVVDTRLPPIAGRPGNGKPTKPSRRERRQARRAAGIPRRLTFRVVLFTILLLAVVAAAYGFLRWYATDNWYVTLDGNHLVIYQGRPGGVLWFKPKLVERTTVTTAGVLPIRVPALASDVDEVSLAKAQLYVATLHQEYQSQRQIAKGQVVGTTTTTTTTVPGGLTTTTAPGSTATTAPATSPTTSSVP